MAYETDERVVELTEKLESGIMDLYASDNYVYQRLPCHSRMPRAE